MAGRKFIHLKPDEKKIAERFEKLRILDGEYVYDVHLDVPEVQFPDWYTKKDIEHWKTLRAKRIDLLVKQKDKHWIIEITPKISKAAIGGVITYRELYKDQYKPGVPVFVAVVCEVDDPAYRFIAEKQGIHVWIV